MSLTKALHMLKNVRKKVKSITSEIRAICLNVLIPVSTIINLISQIMDLYNKYM